MSNFNQIELKTMKKYIQIIVLLAVLASTVACKKLLTEEPQSFVSPQQFFKNEGQCIAALNGCYNPLTNIFNQNLMIVNEAATDLTFFPGTTNKDATFDISPSSPGIGQDLWIQCYKGVMYCNSVVAGIKGSPVDENRKSALIGEAATLRALYYYVLTSTFGDVPFYFDDVADLKTLEQVNSLGRMSAIDTRDSLIKDLNKYAADLPQKRTSDVAQNRISAPVAYMLIAKMAMWNKDWQTALTALNKIKIIYGSLAQYKLTDTWFRNKNTSESIFEVQYIWSATGLKKTSSVAAYFTPYKTGGTIYGGVNIPELGSAANPFGSVTPTEHFMSLYHVLDPRRNMILAYSYNGTVFPRTMQNNGTGKAYMGPKFWCPGMDNLADGNNQKVFRYADALLMIAECANQLDDETTAMSAINEVKMRTQTEALTQGNNITLTLASYPGKIAFQKEVKDERARELMGEYGRKWDLVRWGTFYDDVKSTAATESQQILENLRPFHEYYPISVSEILRSDGKLNNLAYGG